MSTSSSSANEPIPHLQTPPGCIPPAQTLTREMLVSLLADTLDNTFCQGPVKQAVNDGKTHNSTFMFQSKSVPSMTVKQYFQRLAKYTGVSGESMILSMVHIARIYKMLPNFPVNILTIHRLLLTSVLISAKFFDDSFLNNSRYARVGGVTGKELNMLEVEFLFLIDFNLFVSTDEYAKIYKELVTSNPLLLKVFSLSPPSKPANGLPAIVNQSKDAKSPINQCATPATPGSQVSALVANLSLQSPATAVVTPNNTAAAAAAAVAAPQALSSCPPSAVIRPSAIAAAAAFAPPTLPLVPHPVNVNGSVAVPNLPRLNVNMSSPFNIPTVRMNETPTTTPKSNLPTPMNRTQPINFHAQHIPPIAPPPPPPLTSIAVTTSASNANGSGNGSAASGAGSINPSLAGVAGVAGADSDCCFPGLWNSSSSNSVMPMKSYVANVPTHGRAASGGNTVSSVTTNGGGGGGAKAMVMS